VVISIGYIAAFFANSVVKKVGSMPLRAAAWTVQASMTQEKPAILPLYPAALRSASGTHAA
jgi:hypothetical protein